MGVLENAVREDLNENAVRVFGVLDPLKVVITNYPEEQEEEVVAQNHPQRPELGERRVPFSRELFIERADFMEDAPKKFFRLSVGREVRLRYAYLITCQEAVKDDLGRIVELRCTYDPASRGGSAPDGRKVKGTIHWVSAPHALRAEVRLYDRLFTVEYPDADKERNFKHFLNPTSLTVIADCRLEPGLAQAGPDERFQFERQGYFCLDAEAGGPNRPVFNRIVTLRDSWAKQSDNQ
jgi:glutaminyl-tRNA synthetase